MKNYLIELIEELEIRIEYMTEKWGCVWGSDVSFYSKIIFELVIDLIHSIEEEDEELKKSLKLTQKFMIDYFPTLSDFYLRDDELKKIQKQLFDEIKKCCRQ